MTRTRAASLPAGARPRMEFQNHNQAGEFADHQTRLDVDDLADMLGAAAQIEAELFARGAARDSARRSTDAGRLLTPRQAGRLLKKVRILEHRYYGATVTLDDMLRAGGALTGLLSRLSDELLSWVEFWDTYCARHPAGFADDCPEPAASCAPHARGWNPDRVEPLPPLERAQQLTAAPCAPPAGIPAS
jgi:hypothetical protein